MCDKDQLQNMLRAIRVLADKEFGDKLNSVILYGSYARGDNHDESDVDVMILADMDDGELIAHRAAFVALGAEFLMEYGTLVSISIKSLASFEKYKSALPFYANVVREGVRVSA